MSVKAYPLNSIDFYAEDAQLYNSTRTTGVYSSDVDFVVTATSAMNIEVSVGIGWMRYARLRGVAFANDAPLPLPVDMADGYRMRVDWVVGKLDFITNSSYIYIKKGTPAATPVPPQLQRDAEAFEICLAEIRIPAGAIQLNQGMINNAIKLNESVCGVMRDGVTGIPTQQLYDSWWAWFSELQIEGDAAASEFTAWIAIFKDTTQTDFESWVLTKKTEFETWYSSMVGTSTAMVGNWFTAFTTSSETDFNAWFENLQNQLDDNQAANLQNQIDQHKGTGIYSEIGVHNLRFFEGKLQAFTGSGWVTVATATVGIKWEQVDSLALSWAELDLLLRTWEHIEKMIFEEA